MTLDELKNLALAATPGPWQSNADGFPICSTGNSLCDGNDHFVSTLGQRASDLCDSGSDNDAKTDAEYIAAANPQVILKLISVYEKQREALKFYANHDNGNKARQALKECEEILTTKEKK